MSILTTLRWLVHVHAKNGAKPGPGFMGQDGVCAWRQLVTKVSHDPNTEQGSAILRDINTLLYSREEVTLYHDV